MNTEASLIVEQIGELTRIRLQNGNFSEHMERDLTYIEVHKLIKLLEKTKEFKVTPEPIGNIKGKY